MNWLAHLVLSEPTPGFRVGNLLPDLVPASAVVGLAPEILRGVKQHRQIDAFTDTHPIVRRSVNRLNPPLRRFGGIIVDIFYDHFLTRDWKNYSDVSLSDFLAEIYGSFDTCRAQIPLEACHRLEQMQREGWLSSYGDLAGVSTTLSRISRRLRKPAPLADAVTVLDSDYDLLYADFTTFFPELVSHVRRR